jgi:type IV pilus biogenesis protein CpaD/CtpE
MSEHGNSMLQRSSANIHRSQQMAQEILQVEEDVLSQLGIQRDKLVDMNTKVKTTHNAIQMSDKILIRMKRRLL